MTNVVCSMPARGDVHLDPVAWTADLVRVAGEARRGCRPWRQVYPLLDVPVVAHLWSERRVRHPGFWRPASVRVQRVADWSWELAVVVREDLRPRAIAVRVEAAAFGTNGHNGPPGRRLTPLSRLHPDYLPEGLIATAFHVL